jgi:hypothetical protein
MPEFDQVYAEKQQGPAGGAGPLLEDGDDDMLGEQLRPIKTAGLLRGVDSKDTLQPRGKRFDSGTLPLSLIPYSGEGGKARDKPAGHPRETLSASSMQSRRGLPFGRPHRVDKPRGGAPFPAFSRSALVFFGPPLAPAPTCPEAGRPGLPPSPQNQNRKSPPGPQEIFFREPVRLGLDG